MLCCDWLVFNSCDWCISILDVSVICSLGAPLLYGSPVVVFLDRGHTKHNNRRAVRKRRPREHITETATIEMRQSQQLKTNQSLQSIVLYKVTRNQSTSSPEED